MALSNKNKRLLYSITVILIIAVAVGFRIPVGMLSPETQGTITNAGFGRLLDWGIGTDLLITVGLISTLVSVGIFTADLPRIITVLKVMIGYKKIGDLDLSHALPYLSGTFPKVFALLKKDLKSFAAVVYEMSKHHESLRSWEARLTQDPTLTWEQLKSTPEKDATSNSSFVFDLRDPQATSVLVSVIAVLILSANIIQHPGIYIPLVLIFGIIVYMEVWQRNLKPTEVKKALPVKTRISIYGVVAIFIFIAVGMITSVLSSPLSVNSVQSDVSGISDFAPPSSDPSNNMAVVEIPRPVKEVPLGQPVPEMHISARNDYKTELLNVAESLRVSLDGLNASKNVVSQNNATFLGMHEMIEGTTGFNGLNVVHADLNCWYKQGACTMSDGTAMPLDTYSSRVMIATSNGSLSPEEGALLLASSDAAYYAYDAFYVLANKLYAAAYYDKLAKDPANGLSKEDRASNQALADQAYVESFVLEAQLNLRIDQLNVFVGQLGVASYSKIDGVVDFLKKAAENNRAAPIEATATPNPNVVAANPAAILSGAAFTATPDPMNGPLVSSTAVCNRSDGFYNSTFSGWYAASTVFNASISYATYAPCGGVEASQYRVDIYLSNGSHFWIFSADVPSNIAPGQKFLVVPGPEAGGVLNITCKEQGLPMGACPVAQIVP